MSLRNRIARNVKQARTAQGISQATLATKSAVSRSYVSDIERAQVSMSVDVLERLAETLGVDAYDLATEQSANES